MQQRDFAEGMQRYVSRRWLYAALKGKQSLLEQKDRNSESFSESNSEIISEMISSSPLY